MSVRYAVLGLSNSIVHAYLDGIAGWLMSAFVFATVLLAAWPFVSLVLYIYVASNPHSNILMRKKIAAAPKTMKPIAAALERGLSVSSTAST